MYACSVCSIDITITASVVTDFPSIDCDTAKTKAYRKAIQSVKDQAATITCPQECPILREVPPGPQITCGPTCTLVMVNGLPRYDGAADAAGTYRCSAS